jgi:hypothetical protein
MNIITRDYEGNVVAFNDGGWINATAEAAKHGKRVDVWLKTQETNDYIAALCEMTDTTKKGYLKTSKATLANGGGTWLHPKLAVRFAQWLDPRFAVWCDTQIDNLIRGKDDWRKLRHQSASSFKVANDILKLVREANGKDTETHHYTNEARLINWVLTGEFKGVDRDALPADQLNLLAHLQERNAVLIGRGIGYEDRKPMLKSYAMDWRLNLLMVTQ